MPEAISPMAFLRDLQVVTIVDPIDMTFRMAPGTKLFVGDGDALIVGHDRQIAVGGTSAFQVLGTGGADSAMSLARFSANVSGPSLNFLKSRGTTIGSNGALVGGDVAGTIDWRVDDGTDFVSIGATILAINDVGGHSENDTPLALVFQTTAPAASNPTERMRLGSDGNMQMTGDINPEADGTRDLGTQTTRQWANLWSDLVNGADYGFDNGWRALESDVFQGYGPGIAFASGPYFETGKALGVKHVKIGTVDEDILDEDGNITGQRTVDVMERQQVRDVAQTPTFVVTQDFIEFQGRRLTPAILDKLIAL